MPFIPGQRWYSSTEPELGLGTVLRLSGRQVQLVFTGSGMLRHYAIGTAPLLRVAFRGMLNLNWFPAMANAQA